MRRKREILVGAVTWIGGLIVVASLFLSFPRVPFAIFGFAVLGAIWFALLYWHSMTENTHLTYYIGYLLLMGETRAIRKQSFEQWIRESNAKEALTLSRAGMSAIQQLADRLAAGDPSHPATSSVLGFNAVLWNAKVGKA